MAMGGADQKRKVGDMSYQDAQFLAQWLRGNGMWPPNLDIRNPRTWWNRGATAALRTALKAYQVNIGAPATGTLNYATKQQMSYGLKLLGHKNPAGMGPGVREKVIETYGPGLASYLTHWELGPILVEAAENGWDQGHLNGAIQKTNWWRQTNSAQRAWDRLSVEDPGEMKNQAIAKAAQLKRMSQMMGLGLDNGRIFNVAVDSLRFGWDDSKVQEILAGYFKMGTKGRQRGSLDEKAEQLMATAAEFFVVLDRNTAYKNAAKIVAGTMTEEAQTGLFAQQAMARFPSLAKAISQGLRPKQYFANHQAAIAQTLERAPESIDMVNDKRWAKVLEFVDDKGRRRPMTIGEAEQYARQADGYRTTRAANQNAMSTVTALGNAFGAVKM
jgi:hypothetical protein